MQCDIQEKRKKLGVVLPYIVVLLGDSTVQLNCHCCGADSEDFIDTYNSNNWCMLCFQHSISWAASYTVNFIQHFIIIKLVDKQKALLAVTHVLYLLMDHCEPLHHHVYSKHSIVMCSRLPFSFL